MRRPLAFLCLTAVLWMTVSAAAGKRTEDSPPFLVREAFLEALDGGRSVTVRGRIERCESVSAGIRLSVNHLSVQKKDKSVISFLPQYKIMFTTEEKDILSGDTVCVQGEFAPHEAARNMGEFDAQKYYLSQDVIGTLQKPRLQSHTAGGYPVRRVLDRLKRRLTASYKQILEDKPARMIAAICLGEKGLMEPEWKLLYQEGGIAHILAVSGLHVSIVGMGLFRLLRRLRAGYLFCAAGSGLAVVLYAMMTGTGISTVRAVLMFLIWAGAQVCGRKNDTVTGASLAAGVIVLLDVRNAGQSSFWLSFSAVLSIAAAAPVIQGLCAPKSAVGKSMAAGVAVWTGMLPCVLYFFYQAAPWSILINLAVLPMMSLLMITGLCAGAVGLLSVRAGMFLAAPVHYLLRMFDGLCLIQQKLPYAVWTAGRPSFIRIAAYYTVFCGVLLLSVRKKEGAGSPKRKTHRPFFLLWRRRLTCALVCIFCTALLGVRFPHGLQVVSLDVGQGDCAFVRMPDGTNCLIDGGSTSQKKVWEYVISRSVKYYGAATLDYVFLSHADEDHISGIREFLESYECGAWNRNVHGITLKHLVLPPSADGESFLQLQKLAHEKGVKVLVMEEGDAVREKRAALTCLAPAGQNLTGEGNEDSMVLMLSYGNFRMLFTGDLEKGAEKRLAQSGKDLSASVLKIGHHGSKHASSQEFLEKVRPEVSVISCGRDNPYGHPAQETKERLYQAGSEVVQTSECGAVLIQSDGKRFTADTFLDHKNRLRTRAKGISLLCNCSDYCFKR